MDTKSGIHFSVGALADNEIKRVEVGVSNRAGWETCARLG
jgi:hypothetical protein